MEPTYTIPLTCLFAKKDTYIRSYTNCNLWSDYITETHIYKKSFQTRDRWRNMTSMPLGVFVKKLQPKDGLTGYDILFAYFLVEAKSNILINFSLP